MRTDLQELLGLGFAGLIVTPLTSVVGTAGYAAARFDRFAGLPPLADSSFGAASEKFQAISAPVGYS